MKTFTTVTEREELAERLSTSLCLAGDGSLRLSNADYVAGGVAKAYLDARSIVIEEDDDGFGLQTEVHGKILPWLHGVPDGATVKAVTRHGRTQWLVFDRAGIRVGVIIHGVGSMWDWRCSDF